MSRSAVELLRLLQRHGLRLFTTADLVTLTAMTPSAATHALMRLAAQELTAKIRRGLWANRLREDIHPFELVPHLTAPWPAYVSLYSALAESGVLAELPQVIYAVSSGRPRRYRTAYGAVHIHHLPERLIWGFEMKKVGGGNYPIAEPEKAFLDLMYLSAIPRSPIRVPHKRGKQWNLDTNKLKMYARRFDYPPLIESLRLQAGLSL